MSRSKDRPVLFEVVSREGAEKVSSLSKLRSTPKPGFLRRKTPTTGRGERPAVESESVAPVPREPAIRFLNGHLRISLGWVGLSAAGVGLLLMLLVTFQAGGRFAGAITGPPAYDDELTKLLTRNADPSVLEAPGSRLQNGARQIATPPAATPKAGPGAAAVDPGGQEIPRTNDGRFRRQKGRHYVTVQHFPRSRSNAAAAAARYLTAQGIACSVDSSGRDIRVFAHEAFWIAQSDTNAARRQRQRCSALKTRIKEVGKEYVKTGGGYAFEGCAEHKY